MAVTSKNRTVGKRDKWGENKRLYAQLAAREREIADERAAQGTPEGRREAAKWRRRANETENTIGFLMDLEALGEEAALVRWCPNGATRRPRDFVPVS